MNLQYILYTVLCSLFKVHTNHQIFSSDILVAFSRLLLLPKHLNWMFLGKCEPFNNEHKGSAWPLTYDSLIYHTFGTQSLMESIYNLQNVDFKIYIKVSTHSCRVSYRKSKHTLHSNHQLCMYVRYTTVLNTRSHMTVNSYTVCCSTVVM